MKVLLEGEESVFLTGNIVRCMKDWVSAATGGSSRGGGSGCMCMRHCKLLQDLIAIEDLYEDQKLQIQWRGQGVVLTSDASWARCCARTKLLWGGHITNAR